MHHLRVAVRGLPVPVREATTGALVAGVVGTVVGFVIGWASYPPTSWFAALEVGVPAALAGAVVGLLVATVRVARGR